MNIQNNLSAAVYCGNLAEIEKWLDKGATVNGLDDNGDPPLVVVIDNHVDLDVLEFLLAHGADVNLTARDGTSPLHSAINVAMDSFIYDLDEHLDLTRITLLLSAGADSELADHKGRTPIDWARAYLPISQPVVTELEKARDKSKGAG